VLRGASGGGGRPKNGRKVDGTATKKTRVTGDGAAWTSRGEGFKRKFEALLARL